MIPAAVIAGSLSGSTEDDHPRIEEMVDAALAFLSKQTGRHFGPVEGAIEYLEGRGDRSLWLDVEPVGAVTVEHDGEAIDPATYEARGRQLVRTDGRWWAFEEYAVAYERGYTEETLPDDIRQCVYEIVGEWWNHRDNAGLQAETIGGYSYTKAAVAYLAADLGFAPIVERTIRAWRRVRI
jgi:hypothetical protein